MISSGNKMGKPRFEMEIELCGIKTEHVDGSPSATPPPTPSPVSSTSPIQPIAIPAEKEPTVKLIVGVVSSVNKSDGIGYGFFQRHEQQNYHMDANSFPSLHGFVVNSRLTHIGAESGGGGRFDKLLAVGRSRWLWLSCAPEKDKGKGEEKKVAGSGKKPVVVVVVRRLRG
ncbi:hypothetical protein LXL04_002708 [Taraxacum kok-saghyz]